MRFRDSLLWELARNAILWNTVSGWMVELFFSSVRIRWDSVAGYVHSGSIWDKLMSSCCDIDDVAAKNPELDREKVKSAFLHVSPRRRCDLKA